MGHPNTAPDLDVIVASLFAERRLPRRSAGNLAGRAAAAGAMLGLAIWLGHGHVPMLAATILVAGGCLTWLVATLPVHRYPVWELVVPGVVFGAAAGVLSTSGHWFWAAPALGLGAQLVGSAVSHAIFRLAWLVPVAAAAALSDVRSATSGVTRSLLDADGSGGGRPAPGVEVVGSHPLEHLMLHFRVDDTVIRVGAVDIAFAAFLLAVIERYGLNLWRSVVMIAASLGLVALRPEGVPLIPLMFVAVAVANIDALRKHSWFSLARWARGELP